MASGMGMPSIGIYSYELFNFFGVENIIRIGSAGGLAESIQLRDVIIGMGACTNSSYQEQYGLGGNFAPIASYELLEKAVEEAKKIVYFTKFHPIGRRPIDGGNADGKFCLVSTEDYIKEGNEERFNVVQIEDPEPMDELEEICALPGIDMIFFGPADFTQGAGYPNDFANPELLEVKKLGAKTARKYGKFAGTVGGIGNQDDLIAMGYNFISLGADVVALADYFKNIVEKCTGKDAVMP